MHRTYIESETVPTVVIGGNPGTFTGIPNEVLLFGRPGQLQWQRSQPAGHVMEYYQWYNSQTVTPWRATFEDGKIMSISR